MGSEMCIRDSNSLRARLQHVTSLALHLATENVEFSSMADSLERALHRHTARAGTARVAIGAEKLSLRPAAAGIGRALLLRHVAKMATLENSRRVYEPTLALASSKSPCVEAHQTRHISHRRRRLS